jgi:hypothetical protein
MVGGENERTANGRGMLVVMVMIEHCRHQSHHSQYESIILPDGMKTIAK